MGESLFQLFRSDIRRLDKQTQKELFLAFRKLVYQTVFFILADRNLTEDVIQEAFIKAMEKGSQTRKKSSMKAWLRQVSRNSALDMIRKNKKYHHVSDFESVVIHKESELVVPDISMEVINKMLHEDITEWLYELKDDFRIVLTLYYVEEMSYKEIVKELKISKNVVAKRLQRARKKMAELYEKKWGDTYEAK